MTETSHGYRLLSHEEWCVHHGSNGEKLHYQKEDTKMANDHFLQHDRRKRFERFYHSNAFRAELEQYQHSLSKVISY